MKPCCECMASRHISVCRLLCVLFACGTIEATEKFCPEHMHFMSIEEYRRIVMERA
jgi:hypothetical protein